MEDENLTHEEIIVYELGILLYLFLFFGLYTIFTITTPQSPCWHYDGPSTSYEQESECRARADAFCASKGFSGSELDMPAAEVLQVYCFGGRQAPTFEPLKVVYPGSVLGKAVIVELSAVAKGLAFISAGILSVCLWAVIVNHFSGREL